MVPLALAGGFFNDEPLGKPLYRRVIHSEFDRFLPFDKLNVTHEHTWLPSLLQRDTDNPSLPLPGSAGWSADSRSWKPSPPGPWPSHQPCLQATGSRSLTQLESRIPGRFSNLLCQGKSHPYPLGSLEAGTESTQTHP